MNEGALSKLLRGSRKISLSFIGRTTHTSHEKARAIMVQLITRGFVGEAQLSGSRFIALGHTDEIVAILLQETQSGRIRHATSSTRPEKTRLCEFCGKAFPFARKTQRFCSLQCSSRAQYSRPPKEKMCPRCGDVFISREKYCSDKCRRETRMERKSAGSGYILLCVDDLTGRDLELARGMTSRSGIIYEHRLVMARAIGRSLRTEEIVHHINNVKKDNRPENLIICTYLEHFTIHILLKEVHKLRQENAALREQLD